MRLSQLRRNYPERLYKALTHSSTVLTVWDNEKLVGLTRVLDDTAMLAQIHYVLVHPDYQGQGIAGKMIEYVKEKYKDFMYIEGMPEDKNNVPFYEKHGFSVMENGAAIQICNYRSMLLLRTRLKIQCKGKVHFVYFG